MVATTFRYRGARAAAARRPFDDEPVRELLRKSVLEVSERPGRVAVEDRPQFSLAQFMFPSGIALDEQGSKYAIVRASDVNQCLAIVLYKPQTSLAIQLVDKQSEAIAVIEPVLVTTGLSLATRGPITTQRIKRDGAGSQSAKAVEGLLKLEYIRELSLGVEYAAEFDSELGVWRVFPVRFPRKT